MSRSETIAEDTSAVVQVFCPGGLIVTQDFDNLPGVVREALQARDDERAARTMARLTGLRCTVRRTEQTTATPEAA